MIGLPKSQLLNKKIIDGLSDFQLFFSLAPNNVSKNDLCMDIK